MSRLLIAATALTVGAVALAAPNGIGSPGGKTTSRPVAPAPITALALGPKGERALVGDARGRVRRFALSPLKGAALGVMPGAVTAIAWQGNTGAAVADDGSVAWIGTSVQVVGRHGTGARALALTPGGMLFTGADDGTIKIWKPGAVAPEARTLRAHDGPVTGLALFKAKYLVSVGWDGKLKSWKLPKRKSTRPRLRKHKVYQAGKREMTAVAVQGERVVTACFDGELVVWRWEKRKLVPTKLPQRTHQEWVRGLSVGTKQGDPVVAIATAEQALLMVDAAQASVTRTVAQQVPPAALALLPTGGAVVGRFDGTVDLIAVGGK